jgi:predicted SAM-dependent methyltransferase
VKKLEVGSGTRPTEGYDHADCNASLPHLEYVCDMDDLHPIADDSYDEVRTVHVIEHVPVHRARRALAEWYRVLRSGGLCHVDTPNLERTAKWYAQGVAGESDNWMRDFASLTDEEQDRLLVEGRPNITLWANFKMFSSDAQYDVHYWNADQWLLAQMFREAGFTDVKVIQTDPSLIVTGRKP